MKTPLRQLVWPFRDVSRDIEVIKNVSYAPEHGRRGLLDMTVLGVLEVSQHGDIANWIVPGKRVPGMGGAMELAQKAKKVMVLTTHLDKNGRSKIVRECTLPLTAKRAADMIITDMAVMEVRPDGLYLREVMHPYSVADVIAATEAEIKVAEDVGVFQ